MWTLTALQHSHEFATEKKRTDALIFSSIQHCLTQIEHLNQNRKCERTSVTTALRAALLRTQRQICGQIRSLLKTSSTPNLRPLEDVRVQDHSVSGESKLFGRELLETL